MSLRTIKEQVKSFRKFLKFLWKRKPSRVNYLLTLLFLFFLPPQGYYAQLQTNWREPKVLATHFVVPAPAPIPKNKMGVSASWISAKSAIVFDVPSWVVLYEKNPHLRLLPASTTKIMTALVALDYYQPEQILEVPPLFFEGQDIKLQKGEKISAENLLYGLLVASANDAAETLAANYPGGRIGFVEEMNRKAQNLSLPDTHFVNPTGIDEDGQFTSVTDLAQLAKVAIQNPLFARIVATPKVVVYSSDQRIAHTMNNVNILLEKLPSIRGIKTGWTVNAGECLVAFDERNERQIISVILGSSDRFGETEKLLNWVFENYRWEVPL